MPKRPVSVVVTADQSTIVCADKFGDVYSLPLLVDAMSSINPEKVNTAEIKLASEERKAFVSSANHLTVHSARNRRALQNQLKQTQSNPEKSELGFEHELLLGHVSMLTDIAMIEEGKRSYIITADRDEHIRISRSIPQAHIVEGFCLGHTNFVSRLCHVTNMPDLLVSGGGDDELYVWNWKRGQLLSKADLRKHVEGITTKCQTSEMDVDVTGENSNLASPPKIAVSNILHIATGIDQAELFILATCEA
jgi:tRNA (guanine-N(7)-)-methyltransferase subunit TRM82